MEKIKYYKFDIGDVKEFWIVARSNATGNWTNVVEVNSTENVTVVDSNVTIDVRPVNLTVVKTANVTVVGNNTLVKFTIVVNNTGVMNATNVTVKDVDQVNFDKLKELNMGILVVGNVVKCASADFVALVESNLNK